MKVNYSDQKVIKDEKSIFLAGPTPEKSLKELEKETERLKELIKM